MNVEGEKEEKRKKKTLNKLPSLTWSLVKMEMEGFPRAALSRTRAVPALLMAPTQPPSRKVRFARAAEASRKISADRVRSARPVEGSTARVYNLPNRQASPESISPKFHFVYGFSAQTPGHLSAG